MGKIVDFLVWIGILNGDESVFYIGGSDVLPPPLKGEEEQKALDELENGSESAKRRSENTVLVSFISFSPTNSAEK